MNKAFRIIWSHTRQAFVVVDELAGARGKRSAGRLLLAGAGAGLLAMATPALAIPACTGVAAGETRTATCSLPGPGLTVASGGTINVSSGAGVSITNIGTNQGLTNSGTVHGSDGVNVYMGSIGGGITNTAGGTISGNDSGIVIKEGGAVVGGINNAGSITGDFGIRMLQTEFGPTPIISGLDNSGIISGTQAGFSADRSLINGNVINRASGSITGNSALTLSSTSVIGDIHNSGTITGTSNGVKLSSASAHNIINDAGATISASNGPGILITNSSSITSIVNSGTISGNMYAIDASNNFEGGLSSIAIDGNNTARFIGAVNAPDADVVLRQNATYTLRGGESFTIDTFNNDGVLGVAASAGTTATIHGNYLQSDAGALKIGAAGDTSYGKLVVDGTATLPDDARVIVDVTPADTRFNTSRLANVLSAQTLNSNGTFAVSDNSLLFDFGAVKNGNAVDLTMVAAAVTPPVVDTPPDVEPPSSGPSAEQVVNHLGNTPAGPAARALDQSFAQNPSGELASHFVGLTTEQQVSDAVTQTLPLLTGGINSATSSTLSGINRVIQARQGSNSGLSSGDEPVAQDNAWIKTFGSWADQDERSGISGFDADTQGLAIGVDGAFTEQTRLGIAFAYAKTNVDSDSRIAPQDAQIDTFQLIGYGSYALTPDTELNFQVDAGQNRNEGKRHMPFADATAKADYDSYSAHAGLGLGHTLRFSETLTFVPSVRADYTWIGDEAYHEKGAGALNLDVDSRDAEELIFSVDGKLNYNLGANTVLSANLGAGYDVINEQTSISSAYAGSPTGVFTTRGLDPSPWLGRAGLGLSHTLDNGTEVSLRYDAESRSDYLNQGASIKARWAF
ncbi:autotransporter domain-containing protein [Pseudomonas baetica]|uniref:autotransporter domain-containing protein n=1 Tax=Pseudomonas baetica TaxID=674054 RepID=UPI003EEDA041